VVVPPARPEMVRIGERNPVSNTDFGRLPAYKYQVRQFPGSSDLQGARQGVDHEAAIIPVDLALSQIGVGTRGPLAFLPCPASHLSIALASLVTPCSHLTVLPLWLATIGDSEVGLSSPKKTFLTSTLLCVFSTLTHHGVSPVLR